MSGEEGRRKKEERRKKKEEGRRLSAGNYSCSREIVQDLPENLLQGLENIHAAIDIGIDDFASGSFIRRLGLKPRPYRTALIVTFHCTHPRLVPIAVA